MSEDETLLRRAAAHAQKYLDDVDERPVRATIGADELRRQLGGKLAKRGEDPADVVDLLARAGQQGTVATQGGRYFGFVVGSSFPVATAADWLVSGWDQNAGLYVLSPIAAVVEQIAGEWIQDLLGIPPAWSVGFVTGGAMANFTALAAARHHVLDAAGCDVEAKGLFGAPPVTVAASEDSHYSIATAARMLGLGADRVRRIPTDVQGRMRVDELSKVLNDTTGPCIVCAQAGNVNTGAFDPIEAIATETAARGAWLHVDGAFGLWAGASPSLRHLVAGIERADSVTTDGHKWLNVPYDCGVAFCAHPEAHRHAMMLAAAYIVDTASERDPRAYAPEESRRARAVPVYAVLRT
ncbi:MAG: pyridoxal phosphate-dependent decarboxylase family protein, partial [Gammaproteobacteria bacterium]